jgi:hypothetical protein
VLRGRFRPVTHVNVDMLLTARRHFKREADVEKKRIVVLTELTLSDLSSDGQIDDRDFLHRVDIICSLGQNVIITNYPEYFRLVNYLSGITRGKKLGIILGIYNLQRVFDDKYYEHLRGGILEAFGALFAQNVKLYVYPSKKSDSDELHTLDTIELQENLRPLFNYLMINNKMEGIKGADIRLLHIISDQVLEKIKKGEEGWEKEVPRLVEKAIKENCLFDYPCDPEIYHQAKAREMEQKRISLNK